jgi:hypothetical protein
MRYIEIIREAKQQLDPREFGTITHGPDLYIHYAHTDAQIRSIVQNGFDLKKFGYTAKLFRQPDLAVSDPRGVYALSFEPTDRPLDRPYIIFKLEPAPNVLSRPDTTPGWSADIKSELARAFGVSGAKLSQFVLKAGIQVIHSNGEFIILDPSRIRIVKTSIPGLIQEDVWHGSGAKFDRFSTAHMSTGEGNQTYGWGLYFTDKKEIAQHYQNKLGKARGGLTLPSGERISFENFTRRVIGDQRSALSIMGYADVAEYVRDRLETRDGDVEWCMHDARMWANEDPRKATFYKAAMEVFQAMLEQGIVSGLKGHLYNVRIPDGPYLDWDRPFITQPKAMAAIVREYIVPRLTFNVLDEGVMAIAPGGLGIAFTAWGENQGSAARAFFESSLLSGEYIYKALSSILGSDKAASLELAKHGIPGLKYLTGTSRGGRGADYNYVIFDDQHVQMHDIHEDVFHGTPHGFDRFSLDRIGSGEGAQVYGWGLYFAGDLEVAEFYRKKLSKDEDDRYQLLMLDGKPVNIHAPSNTLTPQERAACVVHDARGNQREATREMEEWLESRKRFNPETVNGEAYKMDLETLRVLKTEDFTGRVETFQGYMYHVLLPDTDDWLLWDEPLDQQSAVVMNALKELGVTGKMNPNFEWRSRGIYHDYGFDNGITFVPVAHVIAYRDAVELRAEEDGMPVRAEYKSVDEAKAAAEKIATSCLRDEKFLREHHLGGGARAYKVLAKMLGSDKNASIALALKGVAGVKYMDGYTRQGLRYEGEDMYNYVLFDDKNATIMKRELVRGYNQLTHL